MRIESHAHEAFDEFSSERVHWPVALMALTERQALPDDGSEDGACAETFRAGDISQRFAMRGSVDHYPWLIFEFLESEIDQ